MSRIVKLLDGRTVQIDNKGNITPVGTFEKLDKNTYTPQQTTRLPNPDNNVNISGKIDNIDLGDINKSDNTAQVETPIENTVRRTVAPPRRRVASVTPTPNGKGSGSGSSGNKGDKGDKIVTPKDTTTYNADTLNDVIVTGTRKPKQGTQTKGNKNGNQTQQKKYNLPTSTQRILYTQSKQGLSGADPIGQFYVESVLGSKVLKGLKSAYQSGKSAANYIANNAETIARKLTPQVGQNAPRTVQATRQAISNTGKRLKTTTNNPKGTVNNNNVKQQVNSYATRMRNYQQGRVNHSNISDYIAKNAERMRLLSGK